MSQPNPIHLGEVSRHGISTACGRVGIVTRRIDKTTCQQCLAATGLQTEDQPDQKETQ